MPKGTYSIQQVIPENKSQFIKQICPANPPTHTILFTGSKDTLTGKDFANQRTIRPYLTVGVTSTRRRRCFAGTTTISYFNVGTAPATGVKVHVQLPEYVILNSSNVPFTQSEDKSYIFDIGTVAPNTKGTIQIQDSVICGNPDIRGLTQCTKTWITPANTPEPSPDWDKSDISLKAYCLDNGRVKLAIYNIGEVDMADSSSYRILLDAQLAFSSNLKLSKGNSLILQVPANGRTIRLEADQRPNHPTKRQSNITIEACGSNSNGTVSKGYVSQLPQDDIELEVAIDCLPIIDSFDPNDKLVLPQGVTSLHYTPSNTALNYTVRFQNTGTNYAYKVVVVDTLSENLDISTFTLGAVSHAYKLNVTGKGKPVLTFTFDNINLPDSTKDQLASNGFVSFNIRPKKNLPIKTRIENYADIFFDYNEPVRTNTTLNTIYDIPPVVVEAVRLDQSIVEGTPTGIEPSIASLIKIYPNPTSGIVTVELPMNLGTQIQLSVYDALGNTIVQNSLSKSIEKAAVDLSNHTGGLYLIKLQTPTGLIVRRVIKK